MLSGRQNGMRMNAAFGRGFFDSCAGAVNSPRGLQRFALCRRYPVARESPQIVSALSASENSGFSRATWITPAAEGGPRGEFTTPARVHLCPKIKFSVLCASSISLNFGCGFAAPCVSWLRFCKVFSIKFLEDALICKSSVKDIPRS